MLNSLISFGSCFENPLGSTNKNSFTSSFPVFIPFISFSYLIALTRISSTVLDRSNESKHLCLTPEEEKNINSFTVRYSINCRFIIDVLYQAEKVTFYSQFAERRFCFLNHEWVLNFVKCSFSCIFQDNVMVFLLYSVNVVD